MEKLLPVKQSIFFRIQGTSFFWIGSVYRYIYVITIFDNNVYFLTFKNNNNSKQTSWFQSNTLAFFTTLRFTVIHFLGHGHHTLKVVT